MISRSVKDKSNKLKRILSPLETWLYSLGNTGAWVLLTPFLFTQFGPSSIYALLLLVALLFLQVWHVERLARIFPERTGGISGYLPVLFPQSSRVSTYCALGNYFGYVGTFAWIGYLVLDTAQTLFAAQLSEIQAFVWVLFFSLVGYVIMVSSTRAVITVQNLFLLVFLTVVLLFIAAGTIRLLLNLHPVAFVPATLPTPVPLAFLFMLSAGYSNLLSFDSFGIIYSEARNRQAANRVNKYTPALASIIFVLGAWVVFRFASEPVDSLFEVLQSAFEQVFGKTGTYLALIAFISASVSAAAKGVIFVSRLLYQLGRDGLLHPSFAQLNEYGATKNNLLFSAVLTVVFVLLGGVESLYIAISICWLLSYAAFNFGIFLRRREFTGGLLPYTSLLAAIFSVLVIIGSALLSDFRFALIGLALPLIPMVFSGLLYRVNFRSIKLPFPTILSKTQLEYNQLLATVLVVFLVVVSMASSLFIFTDLTGEFIINFAILLFSTTSLFGVAIASLTVFPSLNTLRLAETKTQALNERLRRDIARRQKAERKLTLLSRRDSLTKLKNRLAIEEAVNAYLTRRQPRFALIFLDLDRFKLINDSLGHLVGDQLLVAVSKRLKKILPRPAMLARLGGDEYIVFVPGLRGTEPGVSLAQRILDSFNEPYPIEQRLLATTASVGVVFGDKRYGSFTEAVRDADIAMYESKQNGRNRYTIFTDLMKERVHTQQRNEERLRQALRDETLEIHCQPIVAVDTLRMQGFEVLTRLKHEGELISPNEFIPVANESGLILPLTWQIIEKACQKIVQLHTPQVYASVNISDSFLTQIDLKTRLQSILRRYGVQPEQLHLEILESAIFLEEGLVKRNLEVLHRMGVRLVLDDFGTGYSNLSRLEGIPLSALKIDISFLRGIEEEKGSRLYKAIVELAEALELECVAEGVETQAQLKFVESLQVAYIQGYYFAKPRPIHRINAGLLNTPFDKSPVSKSARS